MRDYKEWTFSHLKEWLQQFNNQVDGAPCSVCQTGEEYIIFSCTALARPGDVDVIEKIVASQMYEKLSKYLDNKKGRIYWRERLECDISPFDVVIKVDANGPDFDFIIDRRCVKDKNWVKIQCFCRCYRASMPVPFDLLGTREVAA